MILTCSRALINSLLFLDFTIEPKSIIVRRGSSAILNCQTNIKTVDVIIQWKKGYQSSWIYDYNNKSYQLLSNHSLFFRSVGTDDENVYFCAAYYRRTRKTIYSNNPAHITLACKLKLSSLICHWIKLLVILNY